MRRRVFLSAALWAVVRHPQDAPSLPPEIPEQRYTFFFPSGTYVIGPLLLSDPRIRIIREG